MGEPDGKLPRPRCLWSLTCLGQNRDHYFVKCFTLRGRSGVNCNVKSVFRPSGAGPVHSRANMPGADAPQPDALPATGNHRQPGMTAAHVGTGNSSTVGRVAKGRVIDRSDDAQKSPGRTTVTNEARFSPGTLEISIPRRGAARNPRGGAVRRGCENGGSSEARPLFGARSGV